MCLKTHKTSKKSEGFFIYYQLNNGKCLFSCDGVVIVSNTDYIDWALNTCVRTCILLIFCYMFKCLLCLLQWVLGRSGKTSTRCRNLLYSESTLFVLLLSCCFLFLLNVLVSSAHLALILFVKRTKAACYQAARFMCCSPCATVCSFLLGVHDLYEQTVQQHLTQWI